MSVIRPSLRLSNLGLGTRALHTCEPIYYVQDTRTDGYLARVAAIQSTRVARDATVSAEETGGFKYIPGGRKFFIDRSGL